MNVKCAKIGSALTFFSTMLLLILVPRPGEAATINVANGDVSGLIAAINTANVTSGADTISLAANGTYTLTTVDHRDIYEGFSGLPVVGSPITISGNGAIIERSNASEIPWFRIFDISAIGQLTLDRVTIR